MNIQKHLWRRVSTPTALLISGWVVALSTSAFASLPTIDNFAPYVEEFKLWYLYGEPGAQDTAFVYHAKWEADSDSTNQLTVLHQEAAPDAQLSFYLKFNECVTGPGCPNFLDVLFHHTGGAVDYSGLIAIPIDEYRAEFWGDVVTPQGGSTPPSQASFGKYQIEIRAKDSAGNYLDITPESPARRTSTGAWSDPDYAPGTNNPDTNHSFNVAPALWVVEGHWNRTYDLVGYRRTAGGLTEGVRSSLPFDIDLPPEFRRSGPSQAIGAGGDNDGQHNPGPGHECWRDAGLEVDTPSLEDRAPDVFLRDHLTPRAYVASDPTDGSCWVYGTNGGSPSIRRVSSSGQLQPEPNLPTCGGLPVWVQVHHGSRAVLAMGETSNAGVYLAKHTPLNDSTWITHCSTLVEAEISTFGSASIDQSAGLLWVSCRNVSTYKLVAVDIETLGSWTIQEAFYGYRTLWAVAANPMDHTVWVASTRGVAPNYTLEYHVARYDQAGQLLQHQVVMSIWDDLWNFTPGGTGICGFPSESTCISANLVTWGVYNPDPPPWGHWCAVPMDRFARLGADSSYHVDDISIPGIGVRVHQAEEYTDNCHFTASRIENGVYWVRHHMPENTFDALNCSLLTGTFTYSADVYLISGNGAGGYVLQPMTSVEFPGFVFDPENELFWPERLSVYGMSCISACAGAKWVQPEERPAATPAQSPEPLSAAVESAPLSGFAYRLGRVFPNPCDGCPGVTIEYSLAGMSAPRFELYNLLGQRMLSMGEGVKAPGEYALRWDLRDIEGRRVPPASYILQMRTEGFVSRTPVLVIK